MQKSQSNNKIVQKKSKTIVTASNRKSTLENLLNNNAKYKEIYPTVTFLIYTLDRTYCLK